VSLCSLRSSTVCTLTISNSHFSVCWFCFTLSTSVFHSLNTVSQYLIQSQVWFFFTVTTAAF
jgi:hypothetical protein